MATMYDVEPQELIEKTATELQKVDSMTPPSWSSFAKTGAHKQRPPARNDWWYVRSASVLRKIYRYGPIGVSKLRIKYGGKKNRGFKPEHTFKGSGNIIRKILQQLEKSGYVKQTDVNGHKGRVITAEGKKFVDTIAGTLYKEPAKVAPVKEAPKKKEEKKEAKAPKQESKEAPVKEESQSKEADKPAEKKEEPKKAEN